LHESLLRMGAYDDVVDKLSQLGTEGELSANGSTSNTLKVQALADKDLDSRFEVAQNLNGEQEPPAVERSISR
jgi:hypothetical protein